MPVRVTLRSTAWAVAIATALLALGCSTAERHEASGIEGEPSALIGGADADAGDLPSTVAIAGECTAAKIGARLLLTAAHCAVDPSTMEPKYGPGKPVELARAPSTGRVEHAVARVHAHPAWMTTCAETLCSISAVSAKVDAPDIAIIELVDELLDVPVSPVDPHRLAPGDEVTLVGFGCTDGVHAALAGGGTLRTAEGAIVDPTAALHDGSFVSTDDVAVFSENYALTAGPGKDPAHAGLCPGDSGGPLYARRAGKLVVVGVNANYTLLPDAEDASGLPETNWHTRVDDASRHGVFAWISSIADSR
jgi:hypothetical protein